MDDATPLAFEQITQEDRALAEFIVSQTRGYGVKLPNHDDTRVQAAARHRIAALSATPAPSDQDASQAQGEVEQIARILCEQHGGDPDAVASEPHDSWDGPLWTVFQDDARSIIAALSPAPGATAQDGVEAQQAEAIAAAPDRDRCVGLWCDSCAWCAPNKKCAREVRKIIADHLTSPASASFTGKGAQ